MPPDIPNLNVLRQMPPYELPGVCESLRQFIPAVTREKKAHIESSLAVVELTVALHYTFRTPGDILIWDVGHQAYAHKILTDRADRFQYNRKRHGISGFPNRSESPYDAFGTGHSSTSISAVMGFAIENERRGIDCAHIAVIGDGALTGGMAFEALNHLGNTSLDVLIVLNDNQKAIDPNTGALHNRKSYRPFFEALGFRWLGSIDGTDVVAIAHALSESSKQKGPRILHVETKFKALPQVQGEEPQGRPFHEVFGTAVVELAEKFPDLTVVTPAMISGAGLKNFAAKFPERLLDVGIAEQHAVTLAAGIAAAGGKALVHLYSTFAQRAYDQIIHDVALQNLPVIFCLDRAGVVGEDGATHHGVFDISSLRNIPNMVIAAPRNGIELRDVLFSALQHSGPFVLRYPRDTDALFDAQGHFETRAIGRAEWLKHGTDLCLMATGTMSRRAKKVADQLESEGHHVGLIHHLFVKPIDTGALSEALQYKHWVSIEDGSAGGLGSALAEFLAGEKQGQISLESLHLPDAFIPHGSIAELHEWAKIDAASLLAACRQYLK